MSADCKRELAIKHGTSVRNSPETQHYGDRPSCRGDVPNEILALTGQLPNNNPQGKFP